MMLQDARLRTYELIDDLDQQQLIGPKIETVNPLQWEIGHIAYFYEYFILRQLYGHESLLGNQKADALYDSISVPHKTRWHLPLLSMAETKKYMQGVLDNLCDRLTTSTASQQDSFIYQFGVFHEDMHTEAFLWGRQTLSYPTPTFAISANFSAERTAAAHPGFVQIPSGQFKQGADPDADFMFDNEKYAHKAEVKSFEISKAPISNVQFAEFVAEGGYQHDLYWCDEGLLWKHLNQANHPGYWIADGPGRWLMRRFDKTILLPEHEPVSHVNWYEANAYCRWAGLRLPTELEWEVAALGEITSDGRLSTIKRRYPWGNTIQPSFANLDGRAIGCVDVAAFGAGDSAFGCRQMLGNVWEWTSNTFQPYSAFSADVYEDYSKPLFGTTKVLRGGAWTSRSRMLHGTYRNFFGPERWDIFSGFRVCKL
jgi:iron(II)-dependent oxidoreductase